MRDRVIDVSSSENGTTTNTRYYQNGQLNAVLAPTTAVASRSFRKRVPTGGKSEPEREKPFLSHTSFMRFPQGKFQRNTGYGSVYTINAGNLSAGYATGSGGGIHGTPAWPPVTDGSLTPRYQYTGVLPGINPDLLSQAEVKALNKLRGKSGQESLDFGLWFGERRETAEMATKAAVGVLQLAQAIARKDFRKSADVLRDVFGVSLNAKAEKKRLRRLELMLRRETRRGLKSSARVVDGIADATLTYNLGLSPLISDLKTAHRRFLTGDLTSKLAVKAVSQHSKTENGYDTQSREGGQIKQHTIAAITHGYTVTLIATPIHSALADLSRLGFANPTNTIYQLIGGSFLLDYILAMGPFLEACTVPKEFTFNDGSWTHRLIINITNQIVSPVGKTTNGVFMCNHTKRTVYTSFPVPIPPLSLKGKDLSFKQSLNVLLISLKSLRGLVTG